jgi:CheY-like chemotaxis protein
VARLKVMVIDDNAHVRRLVKAIVNGLPDAEVCECADGRAAIMAAGSWRADIALVDYEMHPMNGVVFTEQVRAGQTPLPRDLPIVMMTGHADQAHVIRARQAGVNALLAKPLSVGAVISSFEKMFSQPQQLGPDRSAAEG